MSRAAMAAMLAAGACASSVHPPAPAAGQPTLPRGGAQPGSGPALGIFPPNATRVVARVLGQKTYKAESLPTEPYVAEPGTTVEGLTIEIEQASQARADVPVGPAVGTIEAFSRQPVPPGLTGHRIEATVTLAGNTQASRWFISEIQTLPDR